MRLYLITLIAAMLLASTAQASSVTIAAPSDPRVDLGYSVTVSGTADATRYLYVGQSYSSEYCASTASSMFPLSGSGVAVGPGPFSATFTDLKTGPGPVRPTYCAYVSTSSGAMPEATDLISFTVRPAIASVALSAPVEPRVDLGYSVTVSGTAEAARYLYVGQSYSSEYCASTASSMFPLSGSGVAIGPGPFSKTFTDFKTGPGPVRPTYCAYVSTSSGATPDATDLLSFSVRTATASASIELPSSAAVGTAYSITVSGTTEAARYLYVGQSYSSDYCTSTASSMFPLSGNGVAIGPGSFSKTFTDLKTGKGTARPTYCAYVSTSSGATPDATARGSLTVVDPAETPAPTPPPQFEPAALTPARTPTEAPAALDPLGKSEALSILDSQLSARYGGENYRPEHSGTWTACPTQEAGIFDDDDTVTRLCEFRFLDPSAKKSAPWRHGSAIVVKDASGDTYLDKVSSSTFSKTLRTCKVRRNLRGYRPQVLDRVLRADGYVGCADLMVRDLNNLPPGIHRVGFHGTNRAGFEEAVVFRCRVTGRNGSRFARCQNELGNRFEYRWLLRTPAPKPKPSTSTSNSGSAGPPASGGDKNCSDFSTHAEAQAWFEENGGSSFNNVSGLDADHDGKACESLP